MSTVSHLISCEVNYEQIEISTIITAANFGTYLGIVPSLIYDTLGPRTACLLGMALISTGYAGAYLITAGILPSHYLLMSLFFFIMGQGSSATYTSSLATNVKNFPANVRGLVTGVLVAAFGISAAVFSLAFRSLFHGNLEHFFVFMAACGFCIPAVGVLFMTYRWVPEDEYVKQTLKATGHEEGKSLLQSGSGKKTHVSDMYSSFGPEETNESFSGVREATTNDDGNNIGSISSPITEFLSEEDIRKEMDQMVLVPEDSSPLRMFLSLDFALLILSCCSAIGSGLLVINNLGSIVLSYNGQDGDQNIPVIVLSLCNCFGRMLFGVLSDRFRRWLSRPGWLALCVFIISVTMLAFAFIPLMGSAYSFPLLYTVVVMMGLAYGGIMSLSPSFIGDRFGQRNLGINLNLTMIGPIIGTFAIASWLASFFYQRGVPDDGSNLCKGRMCWQPTFIICSALCAIGTLVCALLTYRSRLMYTKRSEHYADYSDFKRASTFSRKA